MKIELTARQKEILKSLRSRSAKDFHGMLNELENGDFSIIHIEALCSLINDEFLMEGIMSDFEPNAYGLELEVLLNLVNGVRIKGWVIDVDARRHVLGR